MIRSARFTTPKRAIVVAVCGAVLSLVNVAHAAPEKIIGSAYSLKTGALLYRETHQRLDDNTHKVDYSEPNGRIFARKTLDFSQSQIAPSFSQLNERNGETIDVKQVEDRLQVNYLENSASEREEESVPLVSGMVVDAGFDAFVKQYWDALAGKKMDIEYLVPSQQRTFSFRVGKTTCVENTRSDAFCFALTPVSWLVKMAVDPIVVAYDPSNKTLLRFTGRANICDENGNYQSVDIQYRYL
ncbi:hypothetical protein HGG82_14740 [Marinomonas sp. M1K-6]|uniref:DUF3108 domain-containing protein n=1 Tax=Marinomonas profundi TaxID=2726122 RepID=A0A847R4F1_9GAMM|nr:hypothetical protein [Marinomonas profundi]NLQ18862.1 hypothetical protein [Marinomonas profundi]UDV01789.1 hypothetical protein J8N69_09205 [Marinomonas profundi]